MTHAAITHIDANTIAVTMTDYDRAHKEAVKALTGTTYTNGQWLLSPLHLPRCKAIFDTMTVAPEAVAAYHAALRRMCNDLLPSAHRKGALGRHIAELLALHANGIAAIKAKGYQPPTYRHVEAPGASVKPTTEQPTDATPMGKLWRSMQGGRKQADRKAAIAKKRRTKKAKVV